MLLPDDNPGDFSYFFDTSGRRTCYIAPERFCSAESKAPEAKMTWAMDIFSAGCVIAQMFLESEIFSLAQLFKYRRGEYDPVITHLSVISDKDVREMIAHMIQLDPERRYSADQYLEFWKDKVFPSYFYNFLHQYMELITDPSSGNSPMSGVHKNMGESDDRIDRVFYDFDKISYFLGYHSKSRAKEALAVSRLGLRHFPVRLSIPNHEHVVSADLEPPEDDGTLIFLTLIVSSMRTTARASSRVRACDVLLAFSERLTDEAKLDRVLPYLMTLLRKEETDMVIVAAIRTITQLLQLVRMPTPINAHVLVEYVLPRLETALGSRSRPSSPLVRATYASCIGNLASTAQRFLEIASSLRADGSTRVSDPELEPSNDAMAHFESVFDDAGRELFEILESHTKQLVEDPDVHVRRAFLASVPELCMFFQEHSNDVVLTHLNTYLNDRDWTLKCAFFDTIVGIAAFVGSTTLEEFMLPLMVQALADAEEYVVQAALHSLAQLAGLGLLSRTKTWELVDLINRFTMHPSIWVREAAAEFLSRSAQYLAEADVRCILAPLVAPYLTVETLADFSEVSVLDTLKSPLSRAVFDQAITWAATQSDRSFFWKPLQKVRSLTLGGRSSRDLNVTSMSRVVRNDDDEQWLSKLRNLGLKSDDEHKLLALREFIWRLSKKREAASEPSVHNGLLSLKQIGVTPQTVFFNDAPLRDPSLVPDLDAPATGPYTIADALLDASMTIDGAANKTKRANPNRVQSAGPAARRLLSPEGRRVSALRESSASVLASGDEELSGRRAASVSSQQGIRHQSSALSLLSKDGHKSAAETGTSDANAFGKVEGPFQGEATSRSLSPAVREVASAPKQARHTYEGTDPSIQRMLDQMYTDNFPRDVLEFGPMVQPISRSKARAAMPGSDEHWKPEGHLVATFGEHEGPINRIVAAPDHVFFITGGSDGSVRVWDTARLERNITQRSRQTYRHAEGAQVTALCFVENSHCFVSCGSDGSVHVVKVDTVTASGVVRYGKLRTVRETSLAEGEHAVWCEHFRQDASSVLVVATNRSRILGVDLRTMTTLYCLENPVHHGSPTCFCVDRKRNWLCVGTSHGVIDLWDLRFKMRLRGWGVPGKGPIYRICVHPTKGRGKWVCVSGGTGQGEVTVWDLEKTACREIYQTGGSKEHSRGYAAWDVDDDGDSMLGRFATDLESNEAANVDRGVRAMVVGTGISGDDSRDVRHAYMVTGGSDRRLRFWDMSRVEDSCTYSGVPSEEYSPTYSTTHPTTALAVNAEKLRPVPIPRDKNGKKKKSKVVSMQHYKLLQSHLDSVLDVIMIEYPFTMSVSVDRLGVVFVFQ